MSALYTTHGSVREPREVTPVAAWGVSPAYPALRARLDAATGRPLLVGADPSASLWASGALGAAPHQGAARPWGAVGRLVREAPARLQAHYAAEIAAGVDVLCAATAETTPWALGRVGMEHRAALLTGLSVELAQEAAAQAGRPVAVAGWLEGGCLAAPGSASLEVELPSHAERLEQAGCELLVVRGLPSQALGRLLEPGRVGVPVWASLEGPAGDAESVAEQARALWAAGAEVVLVPLEGLGALRGVEAPPGATLGALLSAPSALPGGSLGAEGASIRVIGGATQAHTVALAEALVALHPAGPSQRH